MAPQRQARKASSMDVCVLCVADVNRVQLLATAAASSDL